MQFIYDNKLVVDISFQNIRNCLVLNRSELFYLLAFLKRNGISRALSQCLTHKNIKLHGVSPCLLQEHRT